MAQETPGIKEVMDQLMKEEVEAFRRDMNRQCFGEGTGPSNYQYPKPSRLKNLRYKVRRQRDSIREKIAMKIAPWLHDSDW